MEETLTPAPSEDPSLITVSPGDAASDDAGIDSPYVVYTSSPEYEAELLTLLQDIGETQAMVLESNQRLELQNEASIGILLIFLIVGTLNYIYKFFKMFF